MATLTSALSDATSKFDTSVENYASFSGAQLRCYINQVQVSQLMAVSYAIHTEKAAQYTLGEANPRNFATGKRGIAGTLVFNTFDRSPLLSIFAGSNDFGTPLLQAYSENNGGFQSQFANFNPVQVGGVSLPSPNVQALQYYQNEYGGTTTNSFITGSLTNAASAAQDVPLTYYDQLPPFDLTLTFVNPQGRGAYMVIAGVECINEGGGFNIDEMINQTAFSYVAREIFPLTPLAPNGSPAYASTTPTVAASTSF
jgi:hypothetical protein